MIKIDLDSFTDEQKYQLYQALERDLGVYSIAYIYRDEVENLIGEICDDGDANYPMHHCIEEAIARVIPRTTNLNHDEIIEWIVELAFEIDKKRIDDSISPYRRQP